MSVIITGLYLCYDMQYYSKNFYFDNSMIRLDHWGQIAMHY